jgi:low molecular weight phosphotyrosine protein phosphatase
MAASQPSDTPASTPSAILFVCLGNICRSPLAEAVFAHHHASHPLVAAVASAGTAAYHVGRPPDPRTMAVLARHAVAPEFRHAARQVRDADFEHFRWIVAMDRDNLAALRFVRGRILHRRRRRREAEAGGEGARGGERELRPRRRKGRDEGADDGDDDDDEGVARVTLFGDFEPGAAAGRGEEVEDPYYGGSEGFETAYQQCVRLSRGLVARLEAEDAEVRQATGVSKAG